MRKNLKRQILRKIFLHFGNSLRRQRVGNFEEIHICSEILKKCVENFKTSDLKKFFLYFGNNWRNNYVI